MSVVSLVQQITGSLGNRALPTFYRRQLALGMRQARSSTARRRSYRKLLKDWRLIYG